MSVAKQPALNKRIGTCSLILLNSS